MNTDYSILEHSNNNLLKFSLKQVGLQIKYPLPKLT